MASRSPSSQLGRGIRVTLTPAQFWEVRGELAEPIVGYPVLHVSFLPAPSLPPLPLNS